LLTTCRDYFKTELKGGKFFAKLGKVIVISSLKISIFDFIKVRKKIKGHIDRFLGRWKDFNGFFIRMKLIYF